MADDRCDLETLASFLEEDLENEVKQAETDGEKLDKMFALVNEENEKGTNVKVDCNKAMAVPSVNVLNNPDCDLQAELRMMMNRMKELERKLEEKQSLEVSMPSSGQNVPQHNVKGAATTVKNVDVDLFSIESSANVEVPAQLPTLASAENSLSSSSAKITFSESDSDWEDMEGEKPQLSKQGEKIKKLIKKEKRIAHVPTYEMQKNIQQKLMHGPEHNREIAARSVQIQTKNDSVTRDSFFGIRIKNPLISMDMMKLKMEGRKMVKLSSLHVKKKTTDLAGDWVTMGIIVHKGDPRLSSSGKTFCIWKLCDLLDCDQCVAFFLFGEVYKKHWKNNVGTVVGILNPSIMDSSEKFNSEIAFTINHPQKLMVIGQSRDLGTCQGKKKNGNPCTNIINRHQCEYCTYHVKAAYQKSYAKRTELNTGFTGVTPKVFEKKLLPKGGMYFYQGQSFTSLRIGAKPKRDQLTLKNLQKHQVQSRNQVTVLNLHNLEPEYTGSKLQKLSETKEIFTDLLMVPSVGSSNLVKHLILEEKKNVRFSDAKELIQSVSAKDLLKQHKKKMEEKQRKFQDKKKTIGSPQLPKLGRGVLLGHEVILDDSSASKLVQQSNGSQNLDYSVAKKIAISKIQSKGGILKKDPNAVKRPFYDIQQNIKKRTVDTVAAGSVEKDEPTAPPKKKQKSRYLGNLDLNSKDVQQLIKMKSSHDGLIRQMESEKQETYFSELEKKEKYEEKMTSIMEVTCTLYSCKQCHYTSQSMLELCRTENHNVHRHQGRKRFFKCKKCGTRKTAFTMYPKEPCKHCGELVYEKTSLWKVKQGPKLASEHLSIRGDEAKFLNSLNYKVTTAADF